MTASEAMARLTSSWVIAPTPRPMTRRTTSSPTSILSSASSRASTDPETSPLMMSSSSCRSPDLSADSRSSRVTLGLRCANCALRSRASRRSAICRATRSSDTTRKLSPASGTAVRPSTWTGRDGGASVTGSPFSSSIARTRPNASPVDDRVTDPERAPLHEDGRHRAAAAVEVRLDRHALRVLVGVGPQVELGVGGQDDRLEQVLDADALPGGDVHEQGGAAVLLGHQAVLGQLGPHLAPGPRPPCRSC